MPVILFPAMVGALIGILVGVFTVPTAFLSFKDGFKKIAGCAGLFAVIFEILALIFYAGLRCLY